MTNLIVPTMTADDGREFGFVSFSKLTIEAPFEAIVEVLNGRESVSSSAPVNAVNDAIKLPSSLIIKTPERRYNLSVHRWTPTVSTRSFVRIEIVGWLEAEKPATPEYIVKTILYGDIYEAPWSILGRDEPPESRVLNAEQQLRLSIAATVYKMLRPV